MNALAQDRKLLAEDKKLEQSSRMILVKKARAIVGLLSFGAALSAFASLTNAMSNPLTNAAVYGPALGTLFCVAMIPFVADLCLTRGAYAAEGVLYADSVPSGTLFGGSDLGKVNADGVVLAYWVQLPGRQVLLIKAKGGRVASFADTQPRQLEATLRWLASNQIWVANSRAEALAGRP